MSNVLDVNVSYFRSCTDAKHPATVNLLRYLRSAKHRDAILRIRGTVDKAERDRLKKTLLPGIAPSGIFSNRAESGLVRHSGLLAGDIDFKDNPYNPELLKEQIAKIRNIAYCGLSASGMGLWFLIPVSEPAQHKEHFTALTLDFCHLGIRLDPAPANVASFRFYSWDPNAWFNPEAIPYRKRFSAAPAPARPQDPAPNDTPDRVEQLIRHIEARQLDITAGYQNWFAIGCALAAEFGESGRAYFHRLSRFNPKYHPAETDRQYSACLRMRGNRFGLGSLFYLARGV